MKRLVLIGLLWSTAIYSLAQVNFNSINDQHSCESGSKYLPTLSGEDSRVFELNLFNAYLAAGNSFMSLYDINHIGDSLGENRYYFDRLLDNSRERNTIFAGSDIDLINTSFSIKKDEKPFLNFGFGVRQRNEFQFTFDKNLLALLYRGNAPFAGQTINLLPTLNFLSVLDYHVSGAFTYEDVRLGGRRVKTALTLHRLVGISNVATRRSDLYFYTSEDGRYIDVTADLDIHAAPGVDSAYLANTDFNENTLRNFLLQGHGKGWGIDIGTSLELNEHVELRASIVDFGYIKFNSASLNYSRTSTLRYDGVDLNGIVNPEVSSNFEADSLINFLSLAESKEGYSIGMPTKLFIGGEWHSSRNENAAVPYSTHTASFTYLQGFSNYLSSSVYPCLNIGYTFSARNLLSTGVSATIGGMYGGIMAGSFISFRAPVLKLTIGSNNLLPIFSERAAKSSDGYVSVSVLF